MINNGGAWGLGLTWVILSFAYLVFHIATISPDGTLQHNMPSPRGLTRHTGRNHNGQPGNANLGPYLNCVVWSLAALSTLFLGLRVYSKLIRRRQLWWDDYFLIASWVCRSFSSFSDALLPLAKIMAHLTVADRTHRLGGSAVSGSHLRPREPLRRPG